MSARALQVRPEIGRSPGASMTHPRTRWKRSGVPKLRLGPIRTRILWSQFSARGDRRLRRRQAHQDQPLQERHLLLTLRERYTRSVVAGDAASDEREGCLAVDGKNRVRMIVDSTVDPVEIRPRRSRRETLDAVDDPTAEPRAAERLAARVRFRAYCIACGRSTESAAAPPRLDRCAHCGGTMLVEHLTT